MSSVEFDMTDRVRRLRGQTGYALLTTMIAAACLVPLAIFAAMYARLDFLVQHHTRAALETFTVAESGLEHALADLIADPRFDRLLAGPDRRLGTADDGDYPFAEPPPQFFPRAPFRYQVRVASTGPDAVEISARGFGTLNATRVVVAWVIRAPVPYLPAALSLTRPDAGLSLGAGFRVAGVEARPGDPGVPAVAADGAAAAAALVARLPSGSAGQLVGRGGSPSIVGMSSPSLDALAATAGRRADAQALGSEVHGALGDGVFISPSSLRLVDVSGSGVIIANGALELGGASSFAGVIVALGDVRLDLDGSAAIDGALLSGGTALSLRGTGHVAYDSAVIARIASAFPGLLPRRARITGWREQPDAAL